jgi:hypothetical protein
MAFLFAWRLVSDGAFFEITDAPVQVSVAFF